MSYPSDITRKQFEIILPILEKSKRKTKPRKLDLYDIFNGLLYVLNTGCQWRSLPKDYPNWKSVYYYFTVWNDKKTLNKALKKERLKDKRKAKTSMLIVDAQSVKNTDVAKEKGYDGGKKISGIKRHIAVDTQV